MVQVLNFCPNPVWYLYNHSVFKSNQIQSNFHWLVRNYISQRFRPEVESLTLQLKLKFTILLIFFTYFIDKCHFFRSWNKKNISKMKCFIIFYWFLLQTFSVHVNWSEEKRSLIRCMINFFLITKRKKCKCMHVVWRGTVLPKFTYIVLMWTTCRYI